MTYLPQLGGAPFLTDAGLETWLIFKQGFDLPHFGAFVLLDSAEGRAALRAYYQGFIDLAARHDVGVVLDTPTWRANPDWGERIGYDRAALARINQTAFDLLAEMQGEAPADAPRVREMVIGPRGDGYVADTRMTAAQARDYHVWQVDEAARCGADMACAMTMSYAEEAEGIARAAKETGLPCAIAFTVETDGRLPSGQSLAEAVRQVDEASDASVAYYMINCAHPTHFAGILANDALAARIGGIRANASRMNHAELDEAPELDEGDPDELAQDYRSLIAALPGICVLGGCCGTDHRHVAAIAMACLPRPLPSTTS